MITTASPHGLVVGDVVTLPTLTGGAGLTASATQHYFVATVPSATTLTLSTGATKAGVSFTTDITGGTIKKVDVLKNGVVQRSFYIEKKFADLTKFLGYRGCTPDSMKLVFESKKNVTIEFGFKGARGGSTDASVATTTDAAGTAPIIKAGVSVGNIFINGAATSEAIKKIELDIALNAMEVDKVDSLYTGQHGYGELRVSAQLLVYLQSLELHDAMRANTPVSIEWTAGSVSGSTAGLYLFKIPSIVLKSSNPQASGKNTKVMSTIAGTAVYDSTNACALRVNRINGA